MKVCIHRGTQEVGGTCIEIESQGKRIVLDVGLPLEAMDSIESLPQVEGFQEWHEGLLAVVISHAHLDHYGLARYLHPGTQMIMGAATERILKAARLLPQWVWNSRMSFISSLASRSPSVHLPSRHT